MSGTRRTPIDRTPRPILDAESVRMFRRGTRLMREGCDGEKEFTKIRLALHRRLGLKPWHPNVFDVDLYAPSDPHQRYDWELVASLRDQLIELVLPRPRLAREEREESEADDAGAEVPP